MLFSELPEHLSQHFEAGRKYLVCTRRQAFLAEQSAVFTRQSGEGPAQFHVVDLERLWSLLLQEVGEQVEFSRRDMLKLARVDATILRLWESAGIVAPAEGSYDRHDAYAAVLCGVLRRAGVPVPVANRAAMFVRTGRGLGAAR